MSDIELGKKLYEELNALGSPDEIYRVLKAQGVTARRGKSYSCAVSRYVRMRTDIPYSHVLTSMSNVEMYNTDYGEDDICQFNAKHSTAMNEFVSKFDRGLYPELVDNKVDWDRE